MLHFKTPSTYDRAEERLKLLGLRHSYESAYESGSGLAIRQSLPDIIAVIDPPPCLDAELQDLTPVLRAGRAVAGALGEQ
jgi:hypothetical protein